MAVSGMPLPGSPLGQRCSRDAKFGHLGFQMLHLTPDDRCSMDGIFMDQECGCAVRPRQPLRRDFNRIIVYSDLRITARNRSFLWIERKIS